MTVAVINQPFSVRYQTYDSRNDVFPTAEIIDSNAVSLATLSLPLIGGGLYGLAFTFTVSGSYTIRYRSYTSGAHTTEANYGVQLEAIEASEAFNQAELEAYIAQLLANMAEQNRLITVNAGSAQASVQSSTGSVVVISNSLDTIVRSS
jgi:hypothetical protein